jgi:hypothetical protein
MADVIHRTTMQFLTSVNSPEYPEPTWKWNPDMSQVVGLAPHLWKWDAGTERPIPQTSGEQAATIAARLAAARNSLIAQIDNIEDILRAFAGLLVDELNDRSTTITSILDAIDSAVNLAGLKTAVAGIANPPQRTLAQLRTAIRNKLGT